MTFAPILVLFRSPELYLVSGRAIGTYLSRKRLGETEYIPFPRSHSNARDYVVFFVTLCISRPRSVIINMTFFHL